MSQSNIPKDWSMLERMFSSRRMWPYINNARGNYAVAKQAFERNNRLSAEFWILINHLEVALRNTLNRQMVTLANKRGYKFSWFNDEQNILGKLSKNAPATIYKEIEKAIQRIARKEKTLTESQLLAELPLGFWSRLTSKSYTSIWPDLAGGFPNMHSRDQAIVFESIQDLARIRNRIAHHEPIWNFDLSYYLEIFLKLAAYMDWEFYEYLSEQSEDILKLI